MVKVLRFVSTLQDIIDHYSSSITGLFYPFASRKCFVVSAARFGISFSAPDELTIKGLIRVTHSIKIGKMFII